MAQKISYGIAISEETLGDNAPVPFQGGLEKSLAAASKAGFDSVEIHIRNPRQIDACELMKAAAKENISISAVGTGLEYSMNGLCFTSNDRNVRQQTLERFKEHIDLAAEFGAVVFLGLCRGKAPAYRLVPYYLDMLAEELLPVVDYAENKGVILALEPIVFYLTNLLNTTEETLEFLKRPGLEPVQLLLDTHHMFIEDRDLENSFRMCGGKIAHIHISDSNRKYPGGGNVDYAMVGRVLREIGYDRAVSLEVLPYPDGSTAAELGLKAMRENI